MKQNLLQSLRLRFALLVALLCSLGTGTAWADSYTIGWGTASGSDGTYTNFTATSGTVKDILSFSAAKESSATAPAYNEKSSELRLYYHSGGSGGSVTLTPAEGITITGFVMTTSTSPSVKYSVNGGSATSVSASDNTYTVSGISATSSLKIQNVNTTNTQLRIKTIAITYTVVSSHTLSSAVSPAETGTVTLGATSVAEGSTTSISATPNDDYRFVNWTVSGTGSSVTNATLASTTFTMGTADATVTANFEEIPLHTLSSAVSPVGAGTVTLGATSVREGSTTTASAAAAAGYKFTGWSISGTGAELSSDSDNPTTVTMGTANATVTATFEAVTTYEINWSVNGKIVKTENVEENTAISFTDPTSGVPTGYTFKGWVVAVNRIDGSTDTDPKAKYVTEATSTADITYYAVLAVETTSPYTAHLTGDEIVSNFAATSRAYADEETSYTDTSDGMTWSSRCSTNATRHWIQIKNDADTYIEAAAAGLITEVKVKISNSTNESGGIDDITKHGAFSGNVYLDDKQGTNTGTYGSASSSAIVSNILTITPTKSSSTLYIHVNAAARIWNVDVTYNKVTSSHFCTTVEDYPVTIGSAGYTTYVTPDKVTTPDGVTAYIATAVNTSTIHMEEVTDLPASTPIVLGAASAGTYYLPIITTSTDDVSDNKLLASDGNVTGDESTIYALGKKNGEIGFYLVAEDVKVPAGKAYLNTAGGGSVKEFLTFDFDSIVDGIGDVRSKMDDVRGEIFNLAGQKMSRLQKGINIVNGKKVFVK